MRSNSTGVILDVFPKIIYSKRETEMHKHEIRRIEKVIMEQEEFKCFTLVYAEYA